MTITVSNETQISTSTCAALRAMQEDGEPVFEIATLLGICEEVVVFTNANEKKITLWRRPTDGPYEVLRRLRSYPGFMIEYTENDDYPKAMRMALTIATDHVVESVSENYA